MEHVLVPLLVFAVVLLVGRLVFPPNGIGFEDLLRRTDLDWPHGVQEEEPAPWHLDRMKRRPHGR